MKKELKKINETEKEYWNEGKLQRSKIKKLRRHAFYYWQEARGHINTIRQGGLVGGPQCWQS